MAQVTFRCIHPDKCVLGHAGAACWNWASAGRCGEKAKIGHPETAQRSSGVAWATTVGETGRSLGVPQNPISKACSAPLHRLILRVRKARAAPSLWTLRMHKNHRPPQVEAGLKSESAPSRAPLGIGSDYDWAHTMTMQVGLKSEPRLSGFGGFLQLAPREFSPAGHPSRLPGWVGLVWAALWCGPARAEAGIGGSGLTPPLPGQFQVLTFLRLCWVPLLGFSKSVPVGLHRWICDHSASATAEMTASVHQAETGHCQQQWTSWDHTAGDRWLQNALPRGQLLRKIHSDSSPLPAEALQSWRPHTAAQTLICRLLFRQLQYPTQALGTTQITPQSRG